MQKQHLGCLLKQCRHKIISLPLWGRGRASISPRELQFQMYLRACPVWQCRHLSPLLFTLWKLVEASISLRELLVQKGYLLKQCRPKTFLYICGEEVKRLFPTGGCSSKVHIFLIKQSLTLHFCGKKGWAYPFTPTYFFTLCCKLVDVRIFQRAVSRVVSSDNRGEYFPTGSCAIKCSVIQFKSTTILVHLSFRS